MATGNHFWLDVLAGIGARADHDGHHLIETASRASSQDGDSPPIAGNPWTGQDMRESAVLSRVKHGYTTGARTLASRSMRRPCTHPCDAECTHHRGRPSLVRGLRNVLLQNRNPWLFYSAGAIAFVVGSILDILDGALARAGGKTTTFGAFLDSTTHRIGEGAMLGATPSP